jgi:hypothetical protein
MTENEKDLFEGACYHEAGHAVVAETLQQGLVTSIEVTGPHEGQVNYQRAADDPTHWATICAAGATAQERFIRETNDRRYRDHFAGLRESPHYGGKGYFYLPSDQDQEGIDDARRSALLPSGAADRVNGAARRNAWRAVNAFWPEIDALAQELIRRGPGRMTRAEFEKVFYRQLAATEAAHS